jgi:hypothetical protein
MESHGQEHTPFIKQEQFASDDDRLSDEDAILDDSTFPSARQANQGLPQWRLKLIIFLSAFLLGLLTMGIASIAHLSSSPPPNRTFPPIRSGADEKTGLPKAWSHGDCGNSPSDAKALGCRFDIVLHSWLPENCITPEDDEDAVLMYAGRNWTWSLGNGTQVSLDAVRTGDFAFVHTSFDWHVTHCMYVWKRMHRAMMDAGRRVDSYTINYHHTTHCAEMIGGDATGEMKDAGSKIFAKYPVCS